MTKGRPQPSQPGADIDVIVVGAGPAGCLTARELARRGLRVALLDRDRREQLGLPIVVEVDCRALTRAGVSFGPQDEAYQPTVMRVLSPRRKEAFVIPGRRLPAVALRLDELSRRLLRQAEAAGASFLPGRRVTDVVTRGQRVTGVEVDRGGRRAQLAARLVVDATGHAAALVRRLDPALGFGLSDRPADQVVAANYTHAIDPDRAAAAVRQSQHGDDELWSTVGCFGNYSTEFSHLSLRDERAYILVGRKADWAGPSVAELIDQHRRRLGYYGAERFGGQGTIRIRHAWDRLVVDGFLVVGEAAAMVNPMMGNGVATALLAGQLAAEVAAEALRQDGDATSERLWPYAAGYQRRWGAVLAVLDAFRRLVERWSPEAFCGFMEAGISGPEDVINTCRMTPWAVGLGATGRRLAALLRHPAAGRLLAPLAWLAPAITLNHRAYPRRYDRASFAAWCRRKRRLFAALDR